MGSTYLFSKLYGKCISRNLWIRHIYNKTGKWEPKFSKTVSEELESYWKPRLAQEAKSSGQHDVTKNKYYVLSMFPYPSGKLHMGHVRVYVISDTMARYHRLLGKQVIHPMGWDAFGLPAENAAIERGERPKEWTYKNIDTMKEQLQGLCLSFDWDRELATCDPQYYCWTQYLFLKFYEAGLAYQKEGAVNWDPMDQTVLADEQIDEHGRSWRSGAIAEKRFFKQWYLRTTAYSKSLLEGLDEVNSDLWRDIVSLQKHWIGECNGVRLQLPLQSSDNRSDVDLESLSVFTVHPEAVYGISHILLSPNSYICTLERKVSIINSFNPNYALELRTHSNETKVDNSSDTDIRRLSLEAVNPFTGSFIPVFVDPSRDFGQYLDSHVGIPSCNEDDRRFAIGHNLSFTEVIDSQSQCIINSDKLNGMKTTKAASAVVDMAKTLNCGGHMTSEKARDWLISRQRYWGTPIPIIHCPTHGAVPVPYTDLPVSLPEVKEFKGQGRSPLSSASDWLNTKCPKCGAPSERETDTMDTFVDSSWYYLRYLDVNNESAPFSSVSTQQNMPVDLYIGGKEHATMHLYYTRFFCHFLHDIGLLHVREPFINLLTQGMVMGQSFRIKNSNKYIPRQDVDFSGAKPVQKGTNTPVVVDWEKMSKSKYNGVDPQDVLDEYGTDSTRLCILGNVAPKSDRPWSNDVFVGVIRWQNRIWSLVTDLIKLRTANSSSDPASQTTSRTDPNIIEERIEEKELNEIEREICYERNFAVLEVTFHMGSSFLLNTALSRLQSLTNALKKVPVSAAQQSKEYERALADLIIMLSPYAPMFTSELWAGLATVNHLNSHYDWSQNVLSQQWPSVDQQHCVHMNVKVNGKSVYDVPLPMVYSRTKELTKSDALRLAECNQELYNKNISCHNVDAVHFMIQESLKVDLDYIVHDQLKKKKQKR